ncbi:hypothetical protein EJB05_47856, partial [Eragrostis curvula]
MAKKTRSRRQRQRRRRRPAAEGDEAMPSTGEEAAATHAVREETEEDDDVSSKVAVVVLPPHLVDGIVWYLGALESARLAVVCKSWAAIVSRRLADPAPHLFAFRSTATHRRGAIVEVRLGGGRDGDAAAPSSSYSGRRGNATGGGVVTPAHRALGRVTRRTECVGATPSGRLVLVNSRRTVLFNPVTGTFRRITKFPGPGYYHHNPIPVVPIPGGGGGGGDSFFLAGWNDVGLWHADGDEWTVRNVGNAAELLRMAVLCGGSVFAVDADGYIFQISLPTLDFTKLNDVLSLLDKYGTALAGAVEKGYLVEAGGAVHFVWPLFTTRRVAKRDIDPDLLDSDDSDSDGNEDDDYFYEDVTYVCGFDVYRLDMAEAKWEKLASLAGDHALFVSRWSSFGARASEKGCVSNCVYFVCDDGDGDTWGAFSLAQRRMLFENAIGNGSYKERLWFYPRAREPGSDEIDRRRD